MGPLVRLTLTAGLLLAVMGCASSEFDRLFEANRWSEAAQAFEEDSTLLDNDDALFRAAEIRATPNRPTYDTERARELLRRLLRLHPGSQHAAAADLLLVTLDEMSRMRTLNAGRQAALQGELASARQEADSLRSMLTATGNRLREEDQENALLQSVITRLESDLQEREARIDSLGEELDQLKAIDLERKPLSRDRKPMSSDTGGEGGAVDGPW